MQPVAAIWVSSSQEIQFYPPPPGRSMAGSTISGRFVAAMTKTWKCRWRRHLFSPFSTWTGIPSPQGACERDCTPSISVNIWLTTSPKCSWDPGLATVSNQKAWEHLMKTSRLIHFWVHCNLLPPFHWHSTRFKPTWSQLDPHNRERSQLEALSEEPFPSDDLPKSAWWDHHYLGE